MHTIDLKNSDIRTDLIIETIDKEKIPKDLHYTKRVSSNILVEEIEITKENTKIINQKEGTYITISFDDITDKDNYRYVENTLIKELKNLFNKTNIKDNDTCLIIGLGNISSTPDSLGPKAINNVLVTRNIILAGSQIEKGYRVTSKIIPDVTGNTGIETELAIKSVIDNLKPDFIIVVDALKASNINRVNKTIQLNNYGITPGGGVGNKRKELSNKTLNIPVISIGVPTIVDAVSIVNDTFNFLFKKLAYSKNNINKSSYKLKIAENYLKENIKPLTKKEKEEVFGAIGNLNEEETKELIYEVLEPIGYNLMVTPTEIDYIINKFSILIAEGINKALHKEYK